MRASDSVLSVSLGTILCRDSLEGESISESSQRVSNIDKV